MTRAWKHIVSKTSGAVAELATARAEFIELLRLLQRHDDYIVELEKLRLVDETIQAIERLTVELRQVSSRLRDLTSRMQGGV